MRVLYSVKLHVEGDLVVEEQSRAGPTEDGEAIEGERAWKVTR